MFCRFFIDRPVFAAVLSLVITLAGAVALVNLPMTQYPPITPPNITVVASYPGASAEVVAQSVASPIEQQVNGVEGMLYMSSSCANDGSYSLTVTFRPGTRLDFAQVLVQNRVNLALPMLPDVVRQAGVTTRKRNPDMLMVVNLYSPTGEYDQLYLCNYSTLHLREELARVPGVGDVGLFGNLDYSLRVWVDPDRLASLNLTAGDVTAAIREQNQQVAAGQVGQAPVADGQAFVFPVHMLGRLTEPEEFADIVVRRTDDGRQVRVRDVGRVELGARREDTTDKLDGRPTANIGVFQLSDANALDTADRVRAKLEELKQEFPPGLEYTIANDSTPFIRESVDGVVRTLVESVALVALVVLLFLQSWRAAVIPLAAVPVAIIGTFAAMMAVGFTLNTLTLFGLVLAIGIVVDDAIVVVEAVQHKIDHGMGPTDAARAAMDEVSGPVVAVGLVLTAVFVPCAFLGGVTGLFFRQFAVTIAVSTAISAFNSLTLSPALCAILLQPAGARKDGPGRAIDFALGWFFRLFNGGVTRATGVYGRAVVWSLRGSTVVLAVYAGLLGLTGWAYTRLPTGYIPTQDQGRLMCSIQLPDSAALERTQAVVDEVSRIALDTPGVAHTIAVAGRSLPLGANGSNFGTMLVTLKPITERHDPALGAEAIAGRLRKAFAGKIPDGAVAVLAPPAVPGLGSTGGFKVMVEDRSGENDVVQLQRNTERLMAEARKDPRLGRLNTVFRADSPQLFVDVNRAQCQTMGVTVGDVFAAQQAYLGSRYVNDYNQFGRTWQVNVQAEGEFRSDADNVRRLQVRNNKGGMVPLGAVLDVREVNGPLVLTRYNMYPAAAVVGNTANGVSSGDGIKAVEEIAGRAFPETTGYEWTEINYLQIDAGKNVWNTLIFPLSVLFVFLVLAAQYESWALPLAVIPVVPLCVLSSLAGVAVTHSDINIFTQIGFVVLIGLACKNAVLIVEYARTKRLAGASVRDAVTEACQLRLRPIVMTSVAFVLGVAPLVVATGSGAEMRRALGTAVFSGMIGVTLFGLLLTPVFFQAVERLGEGRLFHVRWVRHVGRGVLDLISLRPVRTAAARVAARRPVPVSTPAPAEPTERTA